MAYITRPKEPGCVFCAALAGGPSSDLIIRRGASCFVMLNAYPYNNGHVMVVTNRHIADLTALEPDELGELGRMTVEAVRVLGDVMRPAGYNIGMNLGHLAGAGIADHLHQHVVPRWAGDTNAMTVVGQVRVIPETLQQTAEALRSAWSNHEPRSRPGPAEAKPAS